MFKFKNIFKIFKRKNNVYSRSNIIMVNGTIINGNTSPGQFKKIDENKTELAENIDKLCITSPFVDVNISVSDSSEIKAHFYGEGTFSGEIHLNTNVFMHEMKISIESSSNFSLNGSLTLDVSIPNKTFNSISVKTTSGDIVLNNGISTSDLKINTTSGDININEDISISSLKIHSTSGDLKNYAIFTDADIKTTSGDILLFNAAKRNIIVDISTTSGDVKTNFSNIGYINLSTNTISGDIRNKHKNKDGYTADLDISTISGDIVIF